MKTPTPRSILEEILYKYEEDLSDGYGHYRGDEAVKELINEYLSALRECVLGKKKEVGEMRYGGCNPDEDRGYNFALQDLADLFGGEK